MARRMRRSFRRTRRGNPYEMQQFSWCRVPLTILNSTTCLLPAQFLQEVVNPRREFEDALLGNLPAFARGVTVRGIRFQYEYFINSTLSLLAGSFIDYVQIRTGLVVLPLQPSSDSAPIGVPLDILHSSGTTPMNVITGYAKPRVLWRGHDSVKFVSPFVNPLGSTAELIQQSGSFSAQRAEVHVKSAVRLGMDEAIFLVTEMTTGIPVNAGESLVVALDGYGVAAVKPYTRSGVTQG